ncbi:glycoside hydrolase, catalytic core [Rhizodiscina lignyota]|uniref:beta-N-acetylhexosaminidase n=1 Tax=Rhizodiscina lignyota TaxID=1504668 RepID=A0A9P4M257_9PEZI|nr:glycoside hydrolase, catalytic core [Rhizodiscina lignyota]
MFNFWGTATLFLLLQSVLVTARLVGIPTVPFTESGYGDFSLADVKSIVVDSKYASATDDRGQTLIPPTLEDFATTFASDLGAALHSKIKVSKGEKGSSDAIFLTIGDAGDYLDAAGQETSEGYSLSVSSSGITITGASPLGAWWGTRTILQQLVLSDGHLPYGSAVDSPGWGTRGMMLDGGRHFYPPEFLIEICSYMSFFKQNTFHVHLSDNLFNNANYTREESLELYARFRLWSDSPAVAGLNKHKNESYTREQFDQVQSECAARGVTIIPEIEAPGHALVIVQWKPELGLEPDLSLLNISQPETIPTMELIWGTFLPWFHTKTVSIGADEYTGPADDYNRFVNAMSGYIGATSGKYIRIWGTFPPKKNYTNIYHNVSVQHWEFFDDDPYYDYILNGYSVLNSDDAFYVVNKWSGSYPQSVNLTRTFHGSPYGGDELWYPYIFNMNNKTDNPSRSNPLVLGEVAALWNDYGANASVYSEAYYAWREGIPALADKQWGGNLMESEFWSTFSKLHPAIPAQNLDRAIASKSSTIVKYAISSGNGYGAKGKSAVKDVSGNGYDAKTSCSRGSEGGIEISPSCSFTTPLSSKGRNYTLTLSLKINKLEDPTNTVVLAGGDSSLMLTPNITLFASGNYYRLNSSLPLGKSLKLSIIGQGNQTFAAVSGALPIGDTSAKQEFITRMGINGDYYHYAPMAIEAPLKQIGGAGCGWSGELFGMTLSNEA